MKPFRLLAFSLLFFSTDTFSQIVGGRTTMNFLAFSASARSSAMGGQAIAVRDGDLGFGLQNPSVLNEKMSGQLAFGHRFGFAGNSNGQVGYGRFLKKMGLMTALAFQYNDFGTIKMADERGTITGEMKPRESAVAFSASREVYERVSVGATLKYANSNLILGSSKAVLGDLAAVFHDTKRRLTATILFRNMGGQLDFYQNEREALPFDLLLGVSKRLRYLPFRFSVIGHQLHRRNLIYDDPNLVEDGFLTFEGEEQATKGAPAVDNFFRHLIFSGEFLFGKKEGFAVRFGYDHLRHQLQTVPNLRSLAGFSVGFGLKVSRFRLDYGFTSQHLAGGTSHFSLSTNLDQFF